MDLVEAVLNSAVRLMIPLLLAALGELISQRAGVMNIGLEGFMTAGAFTAFLVAVSGWGIGTAIVLAAAAAAAVAAVMAVGAVWLRANAILVGFAIFVLVPGLANFLYVQSGNLDPTPEVPTWRVPFLASLPLVGPVVFDQKVFYWLAVGLALAVLWLFARTQVGLVVTATGHDPSAVQKRGASPRVVQTCALLVCGALAGLGGAALSLGSVGAYQPNIVGGRGLIAIAIVILGRWTVAGAVGGAFLIALLDAVRLRVSQDAGIPVQLLGAVPWVVVILMLVASTRMRSSAPRTLST